MKRNPEKIKEIFPDWKELCFNGELGKEGEYFARNSRCYGQEDDASIVDYRRATGFEAVVGYLYLIGNMTRLNEILNMSIGEKDED